MAFSEDTRTITTWDKDDPQAALYFDVWEAYFDEIECSFDTCPLAGGEMTEDPRP